MRLASDDVAALAQELGVVVPVADLRRSQVQVLAALARAPRGLRSGRAVARAAGLSPTAAMRALRDLIDLDLVLQGQMYGRASLTCDDASPVFPATRHFSSI